MNQPDPKPCKRKHATDWPGIKFCSECGAQMTYLHTTCPGGHVNSLDARFCYFCGKAIPKEDAANG